MLSVDLFDIMAQGKKDKRRGYLLFHVHVEIYIVIYDYTKLECVPRRDR
jgi:hypothetical protein